VLIDVEHRRVFRRDRQLLWIVVLVDRRPVRRRLIDEMTGEILDEVWQDENGATRSVVIRRTDSSALSGDALNRRAAVDASGGAGASASRGGKPAESTARNGGDLANAA